jgi:hypothetical protein
VDADEMRAIFGAFQRGLDRGRKGLPTHHETAFGRETPGSGGDTPHAGEAITDAHEGTETDDDR